MIVILVGFFSKLSEPLVTASLSGAMVYTLAQSNFTGVSRIIAFFLSFFLGIVGADLTADILAGYLPPDIQGGRRLGAFICSALVVTLSVNVISYAEHNWLRKNSTED